MFDYQAIISKDNLRRIEIENMFSCDIALEAEDNMENAVRTAQKENMYAVQTEFTEKVKQMIGYITGVIKAFLKEVTTLAADITSGTVAFNKKYTEVKKKQRPLKGIKVKYYKYNKDYLNGCYARFYTFATAMLINKPKVDSPITLPKEQLTELMLKEMLGHDAKGLTLSKALSEIKSKFRGELYEGVIPSSQISYYEADMVKYNDIINTTNGHIKALQGKLNTMRNGITIEGGIIEETQKLKNRALSNLSYVFSSAVTVIRYIHDLKFECIFQSRSILKRFYGII